MKGRATEELITELETITQDNISLVSKKCIHLGENQLNWRPKKYSWSILEVLSHVNALADYYNKNLTKKIENTTHKTSKEYFVSSPLGKSAWKSMQLGRANNIKRKFNSPKNQNPLLNPKIIDFNAIQNFIEKQNELLNILEKAKQVNLKKIKVPISISKIVRLRLGDVLMFVVYHNERHIQQIKNILSHPKFPKKIIAQYG